MTASDDDARLVEQRDALARRMRRVYQESHDAADRKDWRQAADFQAELQVLLDEWEQHPAKPSFGWK